MLCKPGGRASAPLRGRLGREEQGGWVKRRGAQEVELGISWGGFKGEEPEDEIGETSPR